MSSSGHVFVVNGRIEDLVHDAAVIPTDEYFVVEPHWDELLGLDPRRLQPSEWSPGGYAVDVKQSETRLVTRSV